MTHLTPESLSAGDSLMIRAQKLRELAASASRAAAKLEAEAMALWAIAETSPASPLTAAPAGGNLVGSVEESRV